MSIQLNEKAKALVAQFQERLSKVRPKEVKQNLWKYEDNELHTDISGLIQELIVLNVFKEVPGMNPAILRIQPTLTFFLGVWIHRVADIRQNNHQRSRRPRIPHSNSHIGCP
jgi:hypothetical protein